VRELTADSTNETLDEKKTYSGIESATHGNFQRPRLWRLADPGRQMAAAAARPSEQPRQAGSEALAAEREQLCIVQRAQPPRCGRLSDECC
jgi:hypothetical protein